MIFTKKFKTFFEVNFLKIEHCSIQINSHISHFFSSLSASSLPTIACGWNLLHARIREP